MAIIRKKEIAGMNEKDLGRRLGDLRLELLKSNVHKSAKSSSKTREIKRTIARILTRLNQIIKSSTQVPDKKTQETKNQEKPELKKVKTNSKEVKK